jgi:hypothetical protein
MVIDQHSTFYPFTLGAIYLPPADLLDTHRLAPETSATIFSYSNAVIKLVCMCRIDANFGLP